MTKACKKIIIVSLCLIMLFSVIGIGMLTASAASVDDLTYKINDGKVIITSCNKDVSGTLIIPNTIEGYPVTSIDSIAFSNCSNLTCIDIPNSVTSIDSCAFASCTNLVSINIPDSVISIGDSAFLCCESLVSVVIPDSVTSIGNSMFQSCSELKSVKIGENVTSIGFSAFNHCSKLESITIPDKVTSIGNSAFWACHELKSVNIGKSVSSIGESVFNYCTALDSIIVDKNNSVYHSDGNCLIDTEKQTLIAGCKSSVIPQDGSVTKIGVYAFRYCSELTSINIPDSVTYIGGYSFYGTGLTSISIPKSVTTIGSLAFRQCSNLSSVTITNSITNVYLNAFLDCSKLRDVYFLGSETDREKISFSKGNDDLLNAVWHYIPTETGEQHTHEFSGKWFYNGTSHWQLCSCGEKSNTAAHSFNSGTITKPSTKDETGEKTFKCRICGYEKKEVIPKLSSDEPSITDKPDSSIPKAYIIIGNPSNRKKTYDYKTSVTYSANVSKGGSVQWYVDDKPAGNGSTLTVKDMKTDYNVKVVVTDKNSNKSMDEEHVTIKHGFFDILIWFFVHLFNPGAYVIKQ